MGRSSMRASLLALVLSAAASPLRPALDGDSLEHLDERSARLDGETLERSFASRLAMFQGGGTQRSSKPSSQGTLSHFTAQGIGELSPTKAKYALVRFARRPVIDYYHCVAAHGMTPGTKGITVGHVAPEVADQLLGHIQGAQRTPEVTHEFCNVAWRAMTCHQLSYTLFYILTGKYFDSPGLLTPMAWVTTEEDEAKLDLKTAVGGSFAAEQYAHFKGAPLAVAPAELAEQVDALLAQSAGGVVLNFQVFLAEADAAVGFYHTWLVLVTRAGAMMLQAYASEQVGYTLRHYAEREDTEGAPRRYGKYDGFALPGYSFASSTELFNDIGRLASPPEDGVDKAALFDSLFGAKCALPSRPSRPSRPGPVPPAPHSPVRSHARRGLPREPPPCPPPIATSARIAPPAATGPRGPSRCRRSPTSPTRSTWTRRGACASSRSCRRAATR